MTTCNLCETGPTGATGHPQLFTEAMTASQVQFRCRTCAKVWSRRYSGPGIYEWLQPVPGAFPGVKLPSSIDQR